MVFLNVYYALLFVFVFVLPTCFFLEDFLFGCNRKFKNGRKCLKWTCPNCLDCPFYKDFKG